MSSPPAVADLLETLAARGETVAVAESLTGGLVCATIVDVPGASRVLRGGLVVYATALKHSLAGVSEALLAQRGPVDPDVALALAEGARVACGATWGLATTGVAGPDPQNGIPAGVAYVSVVGPGRRDVRRLALPGDRAAVRRGAAEAVLNLLASGLAMPERA